MNRLVRWSPETAAIDFHESSLCEWRAELVHIIQDSRFDRWVRWQQEEQFGDMSHCGGRFNVNVIVNGPG